MGRCRACILPSAVAYLPHLYQLRQRQPTIEITTQVKIRQKSASPPVLRGFRSPFTTWPELENKEPENLAEALIAQIKYSQVDLLAIRNKLMFFLWDNVFSRSRLPLCELLGKEVKTFGDFSSKENSTIFIEKVMARPLATKPK